MVLVSGLVAVPRGDGSRQPPSDADQLRRQAMAAFRDGTPLVIVYGTTGAEHAAQLRADAETLGRRYAERGRAVRVVADRDLTDADRQGAAMVVVGRPAANGLTRAITDGLPVQFVDGGFRFGGRLYRKRSHVLQLVSLSPWNSQRPLVLLAGAALDVSLATPRLWLGRRDYTVFDGRAAVRYGRLRDGVVDAALDTDIEAERETWVAGLQRFSGDHVDLHYAPGSPADGAREQLARRLDRRVERALDELRLTLPGRLRYYLYPSVEAKGRLADSAALSHADTGTMVVHAVYDGRRDGLTVPRGVELLLRDLWSAPSRPYLARGFAWMLAGLPYEEAAARYLHHGFAADPRRLAATDQGEPQDLPKPVYQALAASWVAFLRNALGEEGFRRHYAGRPLADGEALTRAWQQRLRQAGIPHLATWRREAVSARRGYDRDLGFQKGFNYAHSNGRVGGYVTARSRESLSAVAATGANAVALVPYGFASTSRLTDIRRAGDSIRTESDESIRVAAADARARGLRVMLKPQIWISSQFWPSQIDFDTDEAWRRWFESYEAWIMGYALLAEELKIDLLCVGTELTYPAIEQSERFRALIERIRRVYHGPLVYAANWHREFEEITFWDALDFIGLDNYYPLSDNPKAAEDELRAGARAIAERVEAVAERHGKPVLFTEVGFASPRTSGRTPDTELERQALLYQITFETYFSRPWFHGLYWWKWFSDPSNSGPSRDEWTPRGKPAERIVTAWFGRSSPPVTRWPVPARAQSSSP